MAPIIGVHGIQNYEYFDRASDHLPEAVRAISTDWSSWLGQGLADTDGGRAAPVDVRVAYYSDVLRRGTGMGAGDPSMLDPLGQELFLAWVEQLRLDIASAATSQGRLTQWPLRQPAEWLTEHYGPAAVPLVTMLVSELATYFDGEFADLRERSRARVADAVRIDRPSVLIAHSLGTVVAYEALCAAPDLRVELFVTLGSPLGMRSVVFDRLLPEPIGKGIRPPGVRRWVNIADRGDPVAVPRRGLGRRFDGVDSDHEVSIHLADPHSARYYLRCSQLADELRPYLS